MNPARSLSFADRQRGATMIEILITLLITTFGLLALGADFLAQQTIGG